MRRHPLFPNVSFCQGRRPLFAFQLNMTVCSWCTGVYPYKLAASSSPGPLRGLLLPRHRRLLPCVQVNCEETVQEWKTHGAAASAVAYRCTMSKQSGNEWGATAAALMHRCSRSEQCGMEWRRARRRPRLVHLVEAVARRVVGQHHDAPAVGPARQGLTLLHFSAQLERFVWNRGVRMGWCSSCEGGVWGLWGCLGCVGCLLVSDTAQVELRSGRV